MNTLIKTAGLVCLALSSHAGAATLSQVTQNSAVVEFEYPANPLTLTITPESVLRPGTAAEGTKWATVNLSASQTTGRLGLRWAVDQPGQTTVDRNRMAVIDGFYNPANKLRVSFWVRDADWLTVNNESFWVLTNAASNISADARLNAPSGGTTVVADRYDVKLEAAIYRP